MTNEEAKRIILEWCDKEKKPIFSWPTDNCNFDHHTRFVNYRNTYWDGHGDYIEFVRKYAEKL